MYIDLITISAGHFLCGLMLQDSLFVD